MASKAECECCGFTTYVEAYKINDEHKALCGICKKTPVGNMVVINPGLYSDGEKELAKSIAWIGNRILLKLSGD